MLLHRNDSIPNSEPIYHRRPESTSCFQTDSGQARTRSVHAAVAVTSTISPSPPCVQCHSNSANLGHTACAPRLLPTIPVNSRGFPPLVQSQLIDEGGRRPLASIAGVSRSGHAV